MLFPAEGGRMRGSFEKQSAKTLFLPSMYLNSGEKSSIKYYPAKDRLWIKSSKCEIFMVSKFCDFYTHEHGAEFFKTHDER